MRKRRGNIQYLVRKNIWLSSILFREINIAIFSVIKINIVISLFNIIGQYKVIFNVV